MIEVHDLYKRFGTVQAVDGISFSARDGEVTGLLGPNGAGKTTTLRMLTGMIKPDQGQIVVDGIDPAKDALAVRRHLGILPDARGLYRHLTARENVEYFGALQGLKPRERQQLASELIEQLGMQAFADRRTEGFSNGQRVKVAIARALIHRPHNVLLDEPTNGLDVMSIRALRGFIAQLAAQGCTVVLSTHVMQEVVALCQRIVIVGHGRVVADGSAQEILQQTGAATLEDAFVQLVGGEGLMA